MMPRRIPTPRRALTLIEIMIAVLVLGLLTGLAAWSFSGPLRRAQLEEAVEQIRYLDATTRQLARESGRPVTIVLDIDAGAVSRREGVRGGPVVYHAPLATGTRIERVRTATEDRTGGTAEIEVSPLGLSPSYAVLVAGPKWRRWVFVSGLGAQVSVISDDSEIASIFAAARDSPRRHPD
jgi:prepilin-type N-terminal cleavage/methylation domain-containing protein